MSRKTSSITYRLGISYFWNERQYCLDNFSFFKVLNAFKLLKGFLFLNNLDLIYYSLNKKINKALIFSTVVYPFKKKEKLLSYKKKVRIKIKFKIVYFKLYFNSLFKNFHLVDSLKIKFDYLFIVLLKFKILAYSYIYLYLYYYKYLKIILLRLILKFYHLESLFFHILLKKNKWKFLRKKEIPLKIMEIYLKEFMRRFYKEPIEVTILNIFRLLKVKKFKLNLNFSSLFRFQKFNYFWNFINIFYLGLLFNKIDLILEVIARGLARKKKLHKRYLYAIIDILDTLYRQKILPLNGMRLVISGKIDSKIRKKNISETWGTLGLQTLTSKLLYSLVHYDTRFGVISLRFWITKI